MHHNREHEALQQCGQAGAAAGRYVAALTHSRSTLAAAQQRTAAAAAQLHTAQSATQAAAATAEELVQQRAAVHTAIAEAAPYYTTTAGTTAGTAGGADVSLTWTQRLQRGAALVRHRSELASRLRLRSAFTALQQHRAQQLVIRQFVARHRGESLLCALSNWRTTAVHSAAVRAGAAAALRRAAVRSLLYWRAAAACTRAVTVHTQQRLRREARHSLAHWRQWARTAAQARALCARLQARRARRSALQQWRVTAAAATAAASARSAKLTAPLLAAEAVVARAARRALAGRCFKVWRVQVIEIGRVLQCRHRALWGLRMWRRRYKHSSIQVLLLCLRWSYYYQYCVLALSAKEPLPL